MEQRTFWNILGLTVSGLTWLFHVPQMLQRSAISGCFLFAILPYLQPSDCEEIFFETWNTVMTLLEGPCAKTSWRALLFHAILGITGAVIVCFDIWLFKQANNSEAGLGGHHLWFWATRVMFNCACVYEFRKVRIRGPRRFYFVGALLFHDNVLTRF